MITTTFLTFALCSNLYWSNQIEFKDMKCNQRMVEIEILLTKEWRYE